MSNVNIVKVTVQCSLRSKQSSLSVLMKEATQGVGPKPLLGKPLEVPDIFSPRPILSLSPVPVPEFMFPVDLLPNPRCALNISRLLLFILRKGLGGGGFCSSGISGVLMHIVKFLED